MDKINGREKGLAKLDEPKNRLSEEKKKKKRTSRRRLKSGWKQKRKRKEDR